MAMDRVRADRIIDEKFDGAREAFKVEVQKFYDAEGFDAAGLIRLYPDILDPKSESGAYERAYWLHIVDHLAHPHTGGGRYMAASQWQKDNNGGLLRGRVRVFKDLPLSAFKFIPETSDDPASILIEHPSIVLDNAKRRELREDETTVFENLAAEFWREEYEESPEVVFSQIPVGLARITSDAELHKELEVLEMAMMVMGNTAFSAWKLAEFTEMRDKGLIE